MRIMLNRGTWMMTVGCMMAIMSSASLAQTSDAGGKQTPAAKAKSPSTPTDSDLLAGPSVEDEASEGNDNMAGPGGGGGGGAQRRRAAESLPPRQWLQAVRALDGLTVEQQDQIASIVQEMEQAQRAFRVEHGDEMRELQEKIGQMRRGGREPDPAVREQLQKIESQMPQPADFQRRVWETLTADQQEALRARIAELEEQMQQQRRRDGARRGAAGSDAGEPSMTGTPPMRRDGEDDMMTSDQGDVMNSTGGGGAGGGDAIQRRRRAAAANASANGLDAMAQRRVDFLRQFVVPSKANQSPRPGDGPTSDQRKFKFEE